MSKRITKAAASTKPVRPPMNLTGDIATHARSKLAKAVLDRGALLISSFAENVDREGGWIAIRKAYRHESGQVSVDTDAQRIELPAVLQPFGEKAKWIQFNGTEVQAVLVPNGMSRTSAIQIEASGKPLVVRMPAPIEDFATRALLGAEAEIQDLMKAAENLLIMKKSLESEGHVDAVAELQKRLKPAFAVLWKVADGSAKITQRLAADMHKRTVHGTTYLTNSKTA